MYTPKVRIHVHVNVEPTTLVRGLLQLSPQENGRGLPAVEGETRALESSVSSIDTAATSSRNASNTVVEILPVWN